MYPHHHLDKEEKLLVDLSLGRKIKHTSLGLPQWEKFREQCMEEGTAGLVYYHLKQIPEVMGKVPPAILSKFKDDYHRLVAIHWAQSLALKTIDDACFEEGLSLLIFRGLVLADLLYRNPGCRPSIDIDLMAAPESLPKVRDILVKQGFTPNDSHPGIFIRPPVTIDLHSDPANIAHLPAYGRVFNYKPDAIWAEAKKFGALRAIHRLGEADQFNFLVLHLVKHSFRRLIWWVDLYKSMMEMDEKTLLRVWVRAGEFRLERLVGGVLFFMGEVFPETRPSFLPDKPQGVTAWLFNRMLQGHKLKWAGMLLYFFSIPEYHWRIRLVVEKLAKRARIKRPA